MIQKCTTSSIIVNARRMRTRVIVLTLCVCVCVCVEKDNSTALTNISKTKIRTDAGALLNLMRVLSLCDSVISLS